MEGTWNSTFLSQSGTTDRGLGQLPLVWILNLPWPPPAFPGSWLQAQERVGCPSRSHTSPQKLRLHTGPSPIEVGSRLILDPVQFLSRIQSNSGPFQKEILKAHNSKAAEQNAEPEKGLLSALLRREQAGRKSWAQGLTRQLVLVASCPWRLVEVSLSSLR